MEAGSLAEQLSRLPEVERLTILQELSEAQTEELRWDWEFWGRPKQHPPAGDWATWVIRAGRGFGKTRTGAEWVQKRAMERPRWIALVARTPADARDYMIDGPGGFMRNIEPASRPSFEVTKRRLTWPNKSWATIYSDEEPNQLRGFSGDTAWIDEFGKFKNPQETWDNLQFGMREASTDRPRRLITTTPRPLKALSDIEKMSSTVVVVGSSYENRLNLDPTWFSDTLSRYEGTRFGRQEIHAEILDDMPGALWTRVNLDENRKREDQLPTLKRIVVAVDPAAKNNEIPEEGAATGIIAVAHGEDNRGYVLDDATIRASPNGWARRAVSTFDRFSADCIVGEVNNGGDMVEATIRAVRPEAPFRSVTASRGKWVRAEPVAALYEQNRVSHVGTFAELEDEMMLFGVNGLADGKSPDRVDALVWGLTELFPQMTEKVIRMSRRPTGGPKFSDPLGAYRVR